MLPVNPTFPLLDLLFNFEQNKIPA
jgi:hypothetical protein